MTSKHLAVSFAIVLSLFISGCGNHHASTDDSQSADNLSTTTQDASSSQDTPLSKADEVAQVNHGATASKVYGNPDKWTGTYVRFPCKISNVVDAGDGTKEANAICGESVTVNFTSGLSNTSDVDYSDPDAVAKAQARQQNEMNVQMKKASDSALLLLTGDKVGDFDGGQVVTIIGKVTGTTEGQNTMGASTQFPTIRVDYAR
ncbi:MAG TPA: hypothetical protein VGF98_04955 [Candidatus Tumulicola sp.]